MLLPVRRGVRRLDQVASPEQASTELSPATEVTTWQAQQRAPHEAAVCRRHDSIDRCGSIIRLLPPRMLHNVSVPASADDFPPGFLEVLGKIVVYSARLEREVSKATSMAVGGDQMLIESLLAGGGFAVTVNRLKLVASKHGYVNDEPVHAPFNHSLPADLAQSIRNIAPKLEEAAQLRNRVVHAEWTVDGNTGQAFRVSTWGRAAWRRGMDQVSTSELSQTLARIQEIYAETVRVSFSLLEWRLSQLPKGEGAGDTE